MNIYDLLNNNDDFVDSYNKKILSAVAVHMATKNVSLINYKDLTNILEQLKKEINE